MSETQRARARGTEHAGLEFGFALYRDTPIILPAFRSNGGISHTLPGELLLARQVGKFYFPFQDLRAARRAERCRYTRCM